jgi:hypothetical protein
MEAKKHTFFAHRVGHGILRRYEFTFNRSGQLTDVSYTEVGKGIGGRICSSNLRAKIAVGD